MSQQFEIIGDDRQSINLSSQLYYVSLVIHMAAVEEEDIIQSKVIHRLTHLMDLRQLEI